MVVQAVVKANSKVNGKGQILIPCGSETPERISMKHRIYNYVAGVTKHANPYGLRKRGGLGNHVTCHMFWFLSLPFFFVTFYSSPRVQLTRVDGF